MIKFLRWFAPLFSERDQVTKEWVASKGAFMGWGIFFADLGLVFYALRKGVPPTIAEPLFVFMEMLTVFILTYMFGHKLALMGSKGIQLTGVVEGEGNGSTVTQNKVNP